MASVTNAAFPESGSDITISKGIVSDEAGRRRNATRICFAGGTCGLLAYGFYYLHLVPFTAPLITCMALTSAYFAFPLLLKTKLPLRIFALICFLWMEVILFATAYNFGGFASPVWPWFGAVPVLTYYYLRGRDRIIVFSALGFGIIGIALPEVMGHQFTSTIPEDQFPMVFMGSTIFAIVFIGAITHVFTKISRQSYIELKAANMAKTRFLANMSHELRTPLNAIVGFTDLIRTEVLGPVGHGKYAEYNTDINSSATHLLHVIEDILNYSLLEADKVKIVTSHIDVKDLVHGVVKQVSFRSDMQRLAVLEECPDNLPLLSGDERLITQVLINLMVNAVKFTGRGGKVTVTADVESNGGIRLSVRDTGVGILPEDIAHVTDAFFKANQDSLVTADGTGLGLSISKEFMTLHGGELTIESQVGSGTEVTCVFPASRSFSRDESPDASHNSDVV